MIIRLWMEKTGPMIFLSHLELMKTLERSFLAGGVKLVHSQGYNPRPHMNFALPLAVGVAAKSVILELELRESNDFSKVSLPRGLRIVDYKEVEKGPFLMSKVRSATYKIEGEIEKLARLEGSEALSYKRKNKRGRIKERDARDFILSYEIKEDYLDLHLKAGSQANLKPAELLEVLLGDKDLVHSYDITLLDVFGENMESLW
ncbi:MAG: DUF2344 domain-containing protein [Tissierellia bacterium]|nr:DUF2344 domain-containing protein [Tissierellia bacterium]